MLLRNIIFVLFIVVLLALQYQLWGGGIKSFYLKRAITEARIDNHQFFQKNGLLGENIQALQNHSISAEDLAREQLGMIKPGEVYYQIIDRRPLTEGSH